MFGKKKPAPQPRGKKAKTVTTPDGKTFPSLAGKSVLGDVRCRECGGRGARHRRNCFTWYGNNAR